VEPVVSLDMPGGTGEISEGKDAHGKQPALALALFFVFFFILVTGPRRSLSLKLSESISLKYEPALWLHTQERRLRPNGVAYPGAEIVSLD